MQPFDPDGNYTDDQVVAVLTGRKGPRIMSYRYDRLDEFNNYVEPLAGIVGGSVANNALGDIKRTAKFSMLDIGSFNFLKDRVRPWAHLAMPKAYGGPGFVEWPLGVFLTSTPTRTLNADGTVTRDVDAYDQLQVLTDDAVGDRYSITAGTKYTTAIRTLTFGLVAVSVVDDPRTLPAAMEWEPGTKKLRILNDLLAAINYESAWFNEIGTLIARPYQAPNMQTPAYDYAANEASIIGGNPAQTLDLFKIANKWVLTVSEADRAVLSSTYVNDSSASPTSTVSRGRTIVDVRTSEDAADQATLDAKAARYAFEASQVYENIAFSSAAMPMHSNADVLTVNLPHLAIDGKYSEHTWELQLKAGELMTHTVRRVVSV